MATTPQRWWHIPRSLCLLAVGLILWGVILGIAACKSDQQARTLWPARNQLVVPMAPIAHASADELDVSKPSPLVIRSEVRTRFVPAKGEK